MFQQNTFDLLQFSFSDPSIIDETSLSLVEEIASIKARCDYALMVGASSHNSKFIPQVRNFEAYAFFNTCHPTAISNSIPHQQNPVFHEHREYFKYKKSCILHTLQIPCKSL